MEKAVQGHNLLWSCSYNFSELTKSFYNDLLHELLVRVNQNLWHSKEPPWPWRFTTTEMATSGMAFCNVTPNLSFSWYLPVPFNQEASHQSGEWEKLATSLAFLQQELKPGQIRWPDPNGIKVKFVPLKSKTLVLMNLSDINCTGLSQYMGYQAITYAFTITGVVCISTNFHIHLRMRHQKRCCWMKPFFKYSL